jgi:hypothetical protein
MAGTWYATATIDFFQYLGKTVYAITTTYILQIFVGASLVAAAYFFSEVLFGRRWRVFILGVYGVWYALFLISLVWYQVVPQPGSFFIEQILSSRTTLFLFKVGFLPLWIGAIILFVRSIIYNDIVTDPVRRFQMLASLALILVGAAGYVDETGLVTGWVITAVRLVTLVASILAFSGMSGLREPEDMIE